MAQSDGEAKQAIYFLHADKATPYIPDSVLSGVSKIETGETQGTAFLLGFEGEGEHRDVGC